MNSFDDLIVFGAAFLIYIYSLVHGFVWDDRLLISGNPFLAHPSNLSLILSPMFWFQPLSIQGGARPVFVFSLLLDHAIWGNNPAGYHLSSVILHGLNSVLVYRLSLKFWNTPRLALLAGLLFAVHPIHAEAVNPPSFRPDLLAAFFVLLSLWAYWRFRGEKNPRRKSALLLASACCYALGLLSKEMAITLPLLVLLCEFILGDGNNLKRWSDNRVWHLATLVLYAMIMLGYLGFRSPRSGYPSISPPATTQSPRQDEKPRPIPKLDKGQVYPLAAPQWREIYADSWTNFLTMSGVFAQYCRLMIIPYPLRADRAPEVLRSAKDWSVWASWCILGGLLSLGLLAWIKGHGPMALGIGWCFITLLPAANIVPLYNPFAERYLYLVSVGIVWALSFSLSKLPKRWRYSTACCLVAAYSGMTLSRNRDWKNDQSLFGKEAERGTKNARVYFNLGFLHQKEGLGDQAAKEYRQALALQPDYLEALDNLGGLYGLMGNLPKAKELYIKALEYYPLDPALRNNLGNIYFKENNFSAAAVEFQLALRDASQRANSWFDTTPVRENLRLCYQRQGKTREAEIISKGR